MDYIAKKRMPHLVILCCFLLGTISSALALSDTTYIYSFSFRHIPIQLNVHQKSDRFELSIDANKLNVTVDSSLVAKGGNAILKVTGFDATSTTSTTSSLPLDLTVTQFNQAMRMLLVSHTNADNVSGVDLLQLYSEDAALNDALGDLYEKIKKINIAEVVREQTEKLKTEQQNKVAEINQAHQLTIDSLLDIIDVVDEENRYGGQFELADKDSVGVPVYKTTRAPGNSLHYESYPDNEVKFYTTSVLIKTFNNFIDLILVGGDMLFNGKLYHVNFYNGDFSIPLKHIFQRRQFLAFRIPQSKADIPVTAKLAAKADSLSKLSHSIVDYQTYMVNISDIIRISKYKKNFTFMIKNDAYLLDRESKVVPYERRTFYDYLSFTTFLDFLGTIEKTPNSLLQIEGRIRLPLKLISSNALSGRNKKYIYSYVFFPRIDAYLNASFINGNQADSRFGTVYNKSTNSADLDTLYIDHFDLIRKNNIRTGIELGIAKHEMKAYNINFYIDYGIHFFRTNLFYTIVNNGAADEQKRFTAWSWTHGPVLRMEYRPDQNLGMDLSFATNFGQRLINSDNDNLRVFEINGPLNPNLPPPTPFNQILNHQRTNYKLEFNAYFMVNPTRSNGGLYFRLSNYFNYNFKQIFPQILVGYSSRLSGMIKNIRNKQGASD